MPCVKELCRPAYADKAPDRNERERARRIYETIKLIESIAEKAKMKQEHKSKNIAVNNFNISDSIFGSISDILSALSERDLGTAMKELEKRDVIGKKIIISVLDLVKHMRIPVPDTQQYPEPTVH